MGVLAGKQVACCGCVDQQFPVRVQMVGNESTRHMACLYAWQTVFFCMYSSRVMLWWVGDGYLSVRAILCRISIPDSIRMSHICSYLMTVAKHDRALYVWPAM